MYSPIRRTEHGWMDNEWTALNFEEDDSDTFEKFSGFEFNINTGETVYLLKPATGIDFETTALFTTKDVQEIVEGGITDSFLTLKDPDQTFRIHPFQEYSYWPPTLKVDFC